MSIPADQQVHGSPSDTVSGLSWNPQGNFFFASSWAQDIRCYQLLMDGRSPKAEPKVHHKYSAPLLCCNWSEDGRFGLFGAADGKAYCWSLADNRTQQIGQHSKPICSIKWCPKKNLVATASWDRTVKFWDIRQRQCVNTLEMPGKPYCMDVVEAAMVVGVSEDHENQKVAVVDMKDIRKIRKVDVSPLKRFMTSIAIFQDSTAYVATGIEGRIAVNHFNPNPNKDFAFKCHRGAPNDTIVYPIHGLSPNPYARSIFASCGGDGTIAFWDRDTRSRVKSYHKAPSNPITALSFHKSGRLLIYARGYDWAKGLKAYDRRQFPTQIYLRVIPEADLKPQQQKNY